MGTSGEALYQLKATDPTNWLTPSTILSQTARTASQCLFSSLKPYTPKTPFDQLLVHGFDGEQIWQQIDLQSQPLLFSIKRDLKRFQKNPNELRKLKVVVGGEEKILEVGTEEFDVGRDDFDEDIHGLDDDDDDEAGGGKEGKTEKEKSSDEGESEGEGKESEGKDEKEEGGDGSGAGIEDGFLKLKDLEDFLEDDEAREYGLKKKDKNLNNKKKDDDESLDAEDGEDEESEDEDDDSDEFGNFDLGDDGDEETEKLENARYEEFFGTKKKKPSQRKSKPTEDAEDSDTDDEQDNDGKFQNSLSTHEKELMKLKTEIEKLEREKLEPKAWTMQGEVAAANRPKNSALEVDIDFKHNMRPPPVITEEFTASIEEMIYKRILEGHFDDVQKAPTIQTKTPREIKELDETKSKKGLGEVYEEEYVQKTNLAYAPLSTTDELKKEASMLFKKLCLKLDSLSHFHFTPKPVIEDMSVQVNVPALAMEEIAPVAVSDAAMLAPEEVFASKGDIKDEGELTRAERKRRRANKKRKYKAETAKRMAKKPRDNNSQNHEEVLKVADS